MHSIISAINIFSVDTFWAIATSKVMLAIDTFILIVALVVGYFPLLKWFPVIGEYVPVGKLVSLLMAATLAFMLGFRMADEREEAKQLRAIIASQEADVRHAQQAADDEANRAKTIEDATNDQHQKDAEYIDSLKSKLVPACLLDESDIGGLPNGHAGTDHKKPAARAK